MKPALLVVLAVLPSFAGASDANEIIGRFIAASARNSECVRGYAYREHRIDYRDGKHGRSETSLTWDVIGLEGSTYRKLVLKNGKPLPPELQKREDDQLRKEAERRRRETPDQRQRRLFSITYHWNVKYENIPRAYNVSYAGSEEVAGRPALVLEAMPRPGFRPNPGDPSERDMPNFRLRLWIDEDEYQLARMDMEVIADGSPLQRGTRARLDFMRLDDGAWVQRAAQVGYGLKLFRGLLTGQGQMSTTYSGHKKFQVDSSVSYSEAR